MTWASAPMTGYALATTSAIPRTARVVGYSRRTVNTDQSEPATTTLCNTPVPIPPEATAIHGITNSDSTAGISPLALVLSVVCDLHADADADRPIVIFNASWFFAVLAHEAREAGIADFALPTGLHLVDPLVIDQHVNPARRAGHRTLSALCDSWQSAQPERPGDPASNTDAALRLAWRIGTSYPPVRDMTPAQLHDAQRAWRAADQEERSVYFASRGRTAPEAVCV